MTVRKVGIERLSVTSSQLFEVVVAALEAAVGRLDNDLSKEILKQTQQQERFNDEIALIRQEWELLEEELSRIETF